MLYTIMHTRGDSLDFIVVEVDLLLFDPYLQLILFPFREWLFATVVQPSEHALPTLLGRNGSPST